MADQVKQDVQMLSLQALLRENLKRRKAQGDLSAVSCEKNTNQEISGGLKKCGH